MQRSTIGGRPRRACAIIWLLWAAWAIPAHAATVAYLTDAELIARADRIVFGRVLATGPSRDPGGAWRTVTDIAVYEDLTGVAGDRLTVVELGTPQAMVVPGAVRLSAGEDVVLFLEAGGRGYRTINLSGSVLRPGPTTEQRGGGTALQRDVDAGITMIGAPAAAVDAPSLELLRDLVTQARGVRSRRSAGGMSVPRGGEPVARAEATTGFTLLAGGLRWFEADSGLPITWYRNPAALAPTGTTGESEIRLALAAWTAPISASIELSFGGSRPIGDGSPFCGDANRGAGLVTFEDPSDDLGSGVLAIGGGCLDTVRTATFRGTTFVAISHAFVVVNDASSLSEPYHSPLNVARILEHEIGHGLGLGHVNTASARAALNIMYPTCCLAATPVPPALGPDDLAGVEFLYPGSGQAVRSCSFSVSPLSAMFPRSGGTARVVVNTAASCGWRAESQAPWLHLVESGEQAGTAAFTYVVDENRGGARSGGLEVADQVIVVTQDAGDSDGDGLLDDWETRFGLDPRSAAGAEGADGDPDHDGRTNAEELAQGGHPRGMVRRVFAEGATNSFFDSSITVFVPDVAAPAHVLVTVLTADGVRRTRDFTLAPRGRRVVRLEDFDLDEAEFSTTIESDTPIAADRVMTWDARRYGGHADEGAASPSSRWYFAEGATHSGFELFYLLVNPNPIDTDVRIRYLLPGPGGRLERVYRVAAFSRRTIWVDVEGQELASTDVATEITSPPNAPIVAERAMYRSAPGRPFAAGHDATGITAPATHWWFAEGATGPFFDTFVLVANPTTADAALEVRYLLPDGSRVVRPHHVAASTRATFWVDAEAEALRATAVAIEVLSVNGVPVVAERAMWWPGPDSASWQEAHVNAGLTTPAARWAFAAADCGIAAPDQRSFLLLANTTELSGRARVTLVTDLPGAPVSLTMAVRASSRVNIDVCELMKASPAGVSAIVEADDEGLLFVVERASYWSEGGQFWSAGIDSAGTPLR